MYFVLQSSIVFAVMASNIYWHWTPNGYVPALLGGGFAYIVTAIVAEYRIGKDNGLQ